jgi:hypothetical protein
LREINSTPVLSPDGRDVIVLSFIQYYGFTPDHPSVLDFVRDPETGRLTQRPGAAGCLEPNPHQGCGRFDELDVPTAFAFAPRGDRALLVAEGQQDQETVLGLSRDGTGVLRPPRTGSGCSSVRPRPACGRLRGLRAAESSQYASLVVSGDGRYAYVLEDGVAILRLD